VIWRTFSVATVATIACALLGYPLALCMSRLQPARQVVAVGFVVIPFWVSILVRTYAWIVVLGNGGIVNRALQNLGLASKPVAFLYNEFGVTVGMVNVLLPYLVLPLYAAMLRVDKRLLQVAATMGASEWAIFWRVFLPITLPALAASMVLIFILSLGFYITPAILGGGKVPMVANMMDFLINRFPNWERAATISACLLVMTLAFYGVYQWARGRRLA
jgi:ABC-type spermidine/putrescine transport system permease subunit I